MKRAVALALLAAGCATPRSGPVPLERLHSPSLCYIGYAGNVADKQRASAELERRSFVCTDAAMELGRQEIYTMQENQARMDAQDRGDARRGANAALGLGALLLSLPPPPAPAPIRPPVVCNTTPNGRTTVCN